MIFYADFYDSYDNRNNSSFINVKVHNARANPSSQVKGAYKSILFRTYVRNKMDLYSTLGLCRWDKLP